MLCPYCKARNQSTIEFPVARQQRASRSKASKNGKDVQYQSTVEDHDTTTKEASAETASVATLSSVVTPRKRKVAPTPTLTPTAVVPKKSVVSNRQKAAVAQRESPVPHLSEPESSGAGPSESASVAKARRVAEKARHEKARHEKARHEKARHEKARHEKARHRHEKARHEKAVRAARLEKCKKREVGKHCRSSSWAAEIDCGVCLETTMDDDERCLSDPSLTDNSSRGFGLMGVHSANEEVDEADETEEVVIDLDTDEGSDTVEVDYDDDHNNDSHAGTMEVNYDSDDKNEGRSDGRDIYTKMLDAEIDFKNLDFDAGLGENEVTNEEMQGKDSEQEEEEEQGQQSEQEEEEEEEQGQQTEKEDEEEKEVQKRRSEQEEQEELFWALGKKSTEAREMRRALREEIFANEKVNTHGPAFVDSSALADRNTVREAFYEVRDAMKLMSEVDCNLDSLMDMLDEKRLLLTLDEHRFISKSMQAAQASIGVLFGTRKNLLECLNRK
ncbi:hypothetical protein BGZ70_003532 [Mortierella alpina]|uniref:Uncharacterized protein n=1 Tax=Mortierella alpina TaxID=64518 RepID=A0A9P6ISN0_MORAP|nr:hypothetical protein BGZ70_003532 [Mortierella alpina]